MSSKTKVVPSQPSAEETALTQKQVELATFQLEELQRQSTLQQEFAGQIQPLLDIQAKQAEQALAQAEKFGKTQLKGCLAIRREGVYNNSGLLKQQARRRETGAGLLF